MAGGRECVDDGFELCDELAVGAGGERRADAIFDELDGGGGVSPAHFPLAGQSQLVAPGAVGVAGAGYDPSRSRR